MNTTWWSLEWTTSPLWLVVNALVAFRLTRLWVSDMLPPLPRVRDAVERWALSRWPATGAIGNPEAPAEHQATERIYGGTPPLAYLVNCAWCSGYWVSLAVFLVATLLPAAVWVFLAVPLAFSAVVGLLHTAAE